jgi:hypothetical protein
MIFLQRTYVFILLLLICKPASAMIPADTIRKAPKPKVQKEYPYQPILIKTSPTAFLWGGIFPLTAEYRIAFEMTGNRKQSDQLAISYLGKSLFLMIYEKAAQPQVPRFKVNGYRVQYAHKFYLVTKRGFAPFGFYFGPLISYSNAKVSVGLNRYYKNVYYDFHHLNLNVMIGIQTGKYKRRATDIYFGLGYKNNKVNYHYTNNTGITIDTKDFGPLYNSHINAVFGINVGIQR